MNLIIIVKYINCVTMLDVVTIINNKLSNTAESFLNGNFIWAHWILIKLLRLKVLQTQKRIENICF